MRLTSSFLIACGFHLLAGSLVILQAGSVQGIREAPARQTTESQSGSRPVALFAFDGTVANGTGTSVEGTSGGNIHYVEGLEGQALSLGSGGPSAFLTLDRTNLPLGRNQDFSVQFWMRTVVDSGRHFVVLSQKEFVGNSLASQKEAGWVFYFSGGTWAWNMGSGDRRITYERDNGTHMPLNDGRWHQLTLTYNSERSEIRLFYDGENKVWYKVRDSEGFDFNNADPLVVGWDGTMGTSSDGILPAIEAGGEQLQALIDTFNSLGLAPLEPDEFVHLVVDPRRLFEQKVDERAGQLGADGSAFRESMSVVEWEPVAELEANLMTNPYTVHQVLSFMEVAPLMKIYALVDGEVTIRRDEAEAFTEKETLDSPEFDMDNLVVWDRILSPEEVLHSYSEFFKPVLDEPQDALSSLRAGSWNIFHGGKHFTIDEQGWDSRQAIAEIIRS